MKQYLMIAGGIIISILIASLVVYLSHIAIIQNIKKPDIIATQYHPPLYKLTVYNQPFYYSSNSNFNSSFAAASNIQPNLVFLNNKDPIFHVYPNLVKVTPFNNSVTIYIYYSVNDKVNIAIDQQDYNITIMNSSVINDQIVVTRVVFTFYNSTPNTIYLIPIWNQYNATLYLIVFYQ
ncbi:MAG: hypothetical protein RRA45_05855 [Saccharolobus sp.]|uniref:hypothetical protein n=1 Tax=Saccharolobus sp. TaxID=2100761 RepID=UPI0028CF9207|nr:hypothetical protein [Saccharolobus sp.]MDT7861718.1 hypothetical protein [Saccharolobus sp.]